LRDVRGWLNQIFHHTLVKAPELEYKPAGDLDVVAFPAHAPLCLRSLAMTPSPEPNSGLDN
jgi:hypothetical protein